MATDKAHPRVLPPPGGPIEIRIPPPEVGIERVEVPTTGVLVVKLAPVATIPPPLDKSRTRSGLAAFSNSNYRLLNVGSSRVAVTAWVADGSVYSDHASSQAIGQLVDALNEGDSHDLTFNLQELVGATQGNIVPTLEAVRVTGELAVEYLGSTESGGVGSVSWGYHIDMVRLQQLIGDADSEGDEGDRGDDTGQAANASV